MQSHIIQLPDIVVHDPHLNPGSTDIKGFLVNRVVKGYRVRRVARLQGVTGYSGYGGYRVKGVTGLHRVIGIMGFQGDIRKLYE